MKIYLDHAAATPLSDSMKQYLISVLDLYGNPSSLHSAGEPVKRILSDARQSVADFIHADPQDIYFTPSGSAANTFAIQGYYSKRFCPLLYSPIAHKSILKCVESYINSYPLKVDNKGFIDFDYLKESLDRQNRNPLVIIDYANSEIGTIQNIVELIDLIHFYKGIVYLDCTGSLPTIPVDVKKTNADMIGFSAHKLGGLKGCGVLYKKKEIELKPFIYGSQEGGLVAGTENVLGIASLGKAVENYDYSSITSFNRDYVYDYMLRNIPNSYLVGAQIKSGNRLPHNLFLCLKGIEGESLMMLLDLNGIQVSTGSACNSTIPSASAALSAIGMPKEDRKSCIRLTFSGTETVAELNYVCEKLKQCVETLRSLGTE